MTWKTPSIKAERYQITFDERLPIMMLTINGVPTGEDGIAMGQSMEAFAKEVKGPWAALSDLRKMPIADRDARRAWVENMKQAIDAGLCRWAIVTERHTTAMQSKNVAEVSTVAAITLVTFNHEEGVEWVRGIIDIDS